MVRRLFLEELLIDEQELIARFDSLVQAEAEVARCEENVRRQRDAIKCLEGKQD